MAQVAVKKSSDGKRRAVSVHQTGQGVGRASGDGDIGSALMMD
jgi:hypothetical protein